MDLFETCFSVHTVAQTNLPVERLGRDPLALASAVRREEGFQYPGHIHKTPVGRCRGSSPRSIEKQKKDSRRRAAMVEKTKPGNNGPKGYPASYCRTLSLAACGHGRPGA